MKTYKILLVILILGSFSSPVFSQKWIVQHSGLPDSENPTLVFSPVNPMVCWGIQDAENPKCVLTTDGGENWRPISLAGIPGLAGLLSGGLFALNADTAWITMEDPTGSNGGIFKTTNGGTGWVKQDSGFSDSGTLHRVIHFFDANNGLCVGNPKDGYWEILTTNDGGTNWTRVPKSNIPISNANDFIFGGKASGNSYWFATVHNGIYRTTDKGLTWKNSVANSHDFAFKDEMHGLGIGYFGDRINRIYATVNGGESWSNYPSGPAYPSAYFITYVPGTSGTYILTSNKNIGAPVPTLPGSAFTTDDGLHWTVIDSLAHNPAAFTTGNVGWSAGNGDTIYKWVPETHTDILLAGSTLKKLSNNQFTYTDGPVWYKDSILLFTDEPRLYSFDPLTSQFRLWPDKSVNHFTLTLDKDGNLLESSGKIYMLDATGKAVKVMAEKYNSKPFNNPNDLIADSKGGIYFTDPDFFVTPTQDKTAVYYVDSTGIVKRVADGLAKPNGIVLSPNETKLYVGDTENKYLYSWDVTVDGSVSGKTTLAELKTKGGNVSIANGMAIDIYGNIFLATEVGIQVFTPQGDTITTIKVPEVPANCDFGGKDFKTLYITAHKNLYSIDLNYPGYAVSRRNMTGANNVFSKQPLLEVFPNPVNGILFVKHQLGKLIGVYLVSMDGKNQSIQLNQQKDTGFELNTQQLKPGIYLLKIVSTTGMATRKFVKY